MPRHAEHGGLEVLLVARQVDEGDDFRRALADLRPVEAAAVAVRFVDHLPVLIETQDVIADAAGASALHLVFVAEELLAGEPAPVVEFPVGEDAQQRAFTGVYVAHNRHSERSRDTDESASKVIQ